MMQATKTKTEPLRKAISPVRLCAMQREERHTDEITIADIPAIKRQLPDFLFPFSGDWVVASPVAATHAALVQHNLRYNQQCDISLLPEDMIIHSSNISNLRNQYAIAKGQQFNGFFEFTYAGITHKIRVLTERDLLSAIACQIDDRTIYTVVNYGVYQ